MAWTALVVVLVLAGCVHCDYTPDIDILDRAITSTEVKIGLMDNELMMLGNQAFTTVGTVLGVVATLLNMIPARNNMQDTRLDAAKNELDDLLEDLQGVAGDAARLDYMTRENNDRFKVLWKQVDDLNAQNNLQAGQLAALQNALQNIDDNIDERVDGLADVGSMKIKRINDEITVLDGLLKIKGCVVRQVTLNVTADNGSAETTVNLNITNDKSLPIVYCAFTGIISTVNEPEGHGYGYKPSDRELTAFTLGCEPFGSDQAKVWVLDRSQSERGDNEVQSLSISVKACTFTSTLQS